MIRNNLSFTLVEILLALAILGIGLVSILSIFVVGTNSIRRTVAMTEASFIAQMTFEDYKLNGYENISIGGPYEFQGINTKGETIYKDYKRVININPVQGVNDLLSIDLKIYYKGNTNPIVEFNTYIAKYEP